MILVVSATPQEIAFLTPRAEVEPLVCGIGPVDSAAQTSLALARGRFRFVVNAGIAGALDTTLRVGEGVVVAQERLELDLETGVPLALPSGITVADTVESDAGLVARLVAAGFRSVRSVTVARVTATDESAARVRALGMQIETMEGFAVLRAAALAGVPAVEVRGISNYARERSTSQWDFAAGTRGLAAVLETLLSL